MDVLGGAEVGEGPEHLCDRAPLTGGATTRDRGRAGPVSARHSASRVPRAGVRRGRSRRGRRVARRRGRSPGRGRGGARRSPGGDPVSSSGNGVRIRRRARRAKQDGQVTANPARASSTIVGPGATRAWKDRSAESSRPPTEARVPMAMAPSSVVRNDRVSCWAVATGTTISAETSSSPTVRIATRDADGREDRDQHVVDADVQPRDPGELAVLRDGEQLRRQPHADQRPRPRRAQASPTRRCSRWW